MPEPMQLRRRVGPALAQTTPTSGNAPNLKIGELLYDGYDDSLYIGYGTDPGNLVNATAIHPLLKNPAGANGAFVPMSGAARTAPINGDVWVSDPAETPGTQHHLVCQGSVMAVGDQGGLVIYSEDAGQGFPPTGDGSRWDLWASGTADAGHIGFSMERTTTGGAGGSLGVSQDRMRINANGNVAVAGLLTQGMTLTTASPHVGGAINELKGRIDTLEAGSQQVGVLDATVGLLSSVKAGLTPALTVGQPLPPGNDVRMTGWFVMVARFGPMPSQPPGIVHQPGATLASGDHIQCDGTQWTHIGMGLDTITAATVGFASIAGRFPATDVQGAIAQAVPMLGTSQALPITGALWVLPTNQDAGLTTQNNVKANGFIARSNDTGGPGQNFFEWDDEQNPTASWSMWAVSTVGQPLTSVTEIAPGGAAGPAGGLGADTPRLSIYADGVVTTANAGRPPAATVGSINIPAGATYNIGGTPLTTTVSVQGPALSGNGLAGTPIKIDGIDGGTWG